MGTPLKVLFVEDSELDTELTTAELTRGGFSPQVLQVETRDEMHSALNDRQWDLIICDYRMPRFSAEAALDTLKASGQDLPFIITSGAVTAEDVVSLLKQGAHDFMDKSALARLVPAIERELRDANVRKQRRQAEARVRILSQAVEQSPVSVVITDPKGKIEYVNPCFENTTGYSASESLGRPFDFTFLDDEREQLIQQLCNTVSQGEQWRQEICSVRANGELIWENVKVSPLTDIDNNLTHYIAVKEDITVRRNYEQQLLRQARYDDLTDLPNRTLMIENIIRALQEAEQHQRQVAILGIDLDHFKNVNDSVGHSIGDFLLKEAANRLSRCIRPGDTLARMGGDEYVVLLPDLENKDTAAHIAQQIVAQFTEPFFIIGRNYYVTCSVGIALYPNDASNPHLLLRNADLAMYQCKDNGRNQFQFFTQDINDQLVERLELENQLRSVVNRNELVLHYQPIYNLKNNTIIGFEALVRWHQPNGTLRMPNNFIPAAERIGVIEEIDGWVLQNACREVGKLLREHQPPLRLAINISSRQLELPDFAQFVREQLHINRIPADQLELEITERVLINDDKATNDNINALAELGVRFSVDDFGTGYSSLGYLQRYPLSTLKIDRSFVSGINQNDNALQLVKTILVLAQGLGMSTVAEGIEDEQQRALLLQVGCEQAQGFLLSIPEAIDEIKQKIDQQL
ncbi:putative bifunctional diguanylate cyclase/phosphodiesterase [Gilvimarinus agarilyticus]|uniref:putative bifunctional diguanylate cyclase/phosphodiesterase n=1 Tax=Gilvimarinus agarilyticus TaxID=679259 RepID=UPI0005A23D52|nr:GGDEF domain-containing response regulator [Gilvimarinus agarilyticus]